MSKLKNIKALQQMLDGSHRLQTRKTFGFSDANANLDKAKVRTVGEIWSEKDFHGNDIWWEQRNGYRVKHHYHPEVAAQMDKIREYSRTFPNCQKDVCTCVQPSQLDQKFKKIMGMCHDCLVTMETKLKIEGRFNQYAIDKMKANAEAFFKEADKEVEILKESFKKISYVDGADAREETWSMGNVDEFTENIDQQYQNFKTKLMEKYSNA